MIFKIEYSTINRLGLRCLVLCLMSYIFSSPVKAQVDVADSLFIYSNLEQALKEPDKVYNLDLSKKKLTEFPKEILQFKNLRTLDLHKNKIKSIPDEISQLKNLRELNVGNNKLAVFSKAICDITTLRRLILNQNDIESIPAEIKQLTNMVYLDLWDNNLGIFPVELGELANTLKEMDLRNIQYNFKEQENITKLLPKTNIHFSPACNCGN